MLDLSLKRPLDAICMGRAGLDLYANELNTAFSDVTQFNKHVGGSPANIAVGMSKLGAKLGFIGKVSDDVVGGFVKEYLAEQGVDVSGVTLDDTGTRTSLAITEMRADNCAVVIYRNNAADLALTPQDVSSDYIASARMLVVSGTALSTSPSRDAVFAAIDVATANNNLVVLDLDYRAYTWTSLAEAAEVYQRAAASAHVLIGNNEEFEVMGVPAGSDPERTAQSCLQGRTHTVLIKAGEAGSSIFSADGTCFTQGRYNVDVVKPFGAGDAYAAAICAGLIQGLSLQECVARGSAAAAIVVAGYSCSAASPDTQALEKFMSEHSAIDISDS